VLKAMLLDTGYPSNWGSSSDFNPDSVERFGLALSNSSSLYVLDPDKVERLVEANPLGCLEYERARQLLRLQGYSFNMKILPPFNVAIQNLSEGRNLKFNVTTTFSNKKPIPNAIVNAYIVYTHFEGGSRGDEERYSIRCVEVSSTTNELGKSVLECTLPSDAEVSHRIAVLQTTVADVVTVTSIHVDPLPDDIGEINVVNDEIIVTHPKSEPNEARRILNMAIFTKNGLRVLYNGSIREDDMLNYGAKYLWSRNFRGLKSAGPLLIIGNIYAVEKGEGRKGILVFGPPPNYLGSRVVEYGDTSIASSTVKLQRSVEISGMTYIAEFVLWKEAP